MNFGDFICEISYLPDAVSRSMKTIEILDTSYAITEKFALTANLGRCCTSCGKEGTYLGVAGDSIGKYGIPFGLFCDDGDSLTLDHIVPQLAGGALRMRQNLSVLCSMCNKKKGCAYTGKVSKALMLNETFRSLLDSGFNEKQKKAARKVHRIHINKEQNVNAVAVENDMQSYLDDMWNAIGHPVETYAIYKLYPKEEVKISLSSRILAIFGLTRIKK